jgi:hypothetical protein
MQKRVAVNQINRSRLEANIKRWKEQGRMYHVGQKRWRRTDSAIAVCQSNYIFCLRTFHLPKFSEHILANLKT